MIEPNVPWYVDAVIYGIDVEKFADGTGWEIDGTHALSDFENRKNPL